MFTSRQALLGASVIALLACALPARAEQFTLCTAMVHNGDNPFLDGKVVVSPVFPTSLTAAYESQWIGYVDQVYGAFENRVAVCSDPADSAADAATGRDNLIYKYEAGFPIVQPDWSPRANGDMAAGSQGTGAEHYDATGAVGGRAFCMLQETQDGQPRALFSQVFTPRELESDYDAAMAHRFVRHAQALYAARPDATATCHRTDSEARAHNDRDHEAEMRRIQGWSVVMTTWSD